MNDTSSLQFRVLLCEDEPLILMAMADLLRDYRLEVFEATDGASALRVLSSSAVDVFVTDVRLPDISGVELARQARSMKPDLPIAFSTGDRFVEGADEVAGSVILPKPCPDEELIATLRQLAESRRQLVPVQCEVEDSHTICVFAGTYSVEKRFGFMTDEEFANLKEPIALVVDDEPLIRMDSADMIADQGFAVVEARTVDEAFAFLKQHSSLQLLFTDVQTPGQMDGFELARTVAESWPHICVVVASGAARPTVGDLPDSASFIPKPISEALVREVIRERCHQVAKLRMVQPFRIGMHAAAPGFIFPAAG